MLTNEQELFLAKLADEGIARDKSEAERIALAEADRIKREALQAQIEAIKIKKAQELKEELEALEK